MYVNVLLSSVSSDLRMLSWFRDIDECDGTW